MANKVAYFRGHDAFPAFPTLADLAFVTLNINASDIWVTAKLGFDSAALSYWVSNSTFDAGYFIMLTGGGKLLEGITLNQGTVWHDFILNGDRTQTIPTPIANKWFIVELHHHNNAFREGAMQCGTSWTGPAYAFNAVSLSLGQWNALNPVVDATEGRFHSVYCDHIMAGTTRRANDIFDDDFSSGDFSNWDQTVNPWNGSMGCEVIDDPGFAPYNTTCNPFDEVFRSGVYLAPVTIPYGNVPVGQVG